MKKRLFTFIMAIVMIFSVCTALPMKMSMPLQANAEYIDGTYEQLTYRNYGDYIKITGCDNSATKVVIPDEIDGVPVTIIAGYGFNDDGFFYGFAWHEKLTSVTIPDSVISIGGQAFEHCSSLTSIEIPDSVTSIGTGAFDYTPWFEEKKKENPLVIVNGILLYVSSDCSDDVIIPNGVTSIADGVFYERSDLTSITIPDSVTNIGYHAFKGCSNLISMKIPKGVIKIGYDTFSGCKSLTSVTIPDSITSIGDSAFSGCESLTSVTIPNSVTSIGDSAFFGCKSLTSIEISNSVTNVGVYAFSGTEWLEQKRKENPLVIVNGILINGRTCSGDVIIPDNVTSIIDCAFSHCSELTSIKIPKNITNINYMTFYRCSNLKSIIIPENVTFIDVAAFTCTNLSELVILNPSCKISSIFFNDLDSDDWNYKFEGTIYAYDNSTAQAFAEEYDYKFESLGKAPQTDIAGDADCNGSVNIADAVVLQKFLLGSGNLTNWENVDLCKDGRIDVFDMIEMRKLIISSQSEQ